DNERELWVALRDARELRDPAARKKHDRKTSLLGFRPEPVGGAVGEPGERCGRVEHQAYAEHAGLLSPCRQQRRRFWILEPDLAHDGEAVGITPDGFKRVV